MNILLFYIVIFGRQAKENVSHRYGKLVLCRPLGKTYYYGGLQTIFLQYQRININTYICIL